MRTRQKDAIADKDFQYFTGKPCNRGHISPRYTVSGSCVACHVEYTREYRIRAKNENSSSYPEWYAEKRLNCPEFFMASSAKMRAKKYRVPFNITAQDIRDIWPLDNLCPIIKMPFSLFEIDKKGSKRNPMAPSLDRLTPSLGYVVGNIAVISTRANISKSDITDPEIFRRMAQWIEKINERIIT